jgi:hypothetical protein
MKNNFENDELLAALAKGQKKLAAPELSEGLIKAAINRPAIGVRRKSALVLSSGFAAVALIATAVFSAPHAASPVIALSKNSHFASGSSDLASMHAYVPAFKIDSSHAFSNETSDAAIYKAVNKSSREELLRKLADYFNVDGATSASPTADLSPMTYIGKSPSGFENRYVSVASRGSLYFQYENADASGYTDCLKISEDPVSKYSYKYCEQYAPYKFPSIDDAKVQAAKIFSDFDLAVTPDQVQIDDRGAKLGASLIASVQLEAAAQPTPVTWQIKWGQRGEITSFAGYDIRFEKAADVQTISQDIAKTRVQILGGTAVAVNPALSHEWFWEQWPVLSHSNCYSTAEKPCIVSIDKAELSSGAVSDEKDVLWLIPAYTYSGPLGLIDTVSALPSDVMQPSHSAGNFIWRYPEASILTF